MTTVTATTDDIPQILTLVNSAYRGESAKKGWTHEADLLSGEVRTDETVLQQMITDPNSVIILIKDDGKSIACVHLKEQAGDLYLGMLSVLPDLQARGLGKQLLAAADSYAIEKGCNRIHMTVISLRTELIRWYQRHGYLPSGITKPFPEDPRYGEPLQALEFMELEKSVKS